MIRDPNAERSMDSIPKQHKSGNWHDIENAINNPPPSISPLDPGFIGMTPNGSDNIGVEIVETTTHPDGSTTITKKTMSMDMLVREWQHEERMAEIEAQSIKDLNDSVQYITDSKAALEHERNVAEQNQLSLQNQQMMAANNAFAQQQMAMFAQQQMAFEQAMMAGMQAIHQNTAAFAQSMIGAIPPMQSLPPIGGIGLPPIQQQNQLPLFDKNNAETIDVKYEVHDDVPPSPSHIVPNPAEQNYTTGASPNVIGAPPQSQNDDYSWLSEME